MQQALKDPKAAPVDHKDSELRWIADAYEQAQRVRPIPRVPALASTASNARALRCAFTGSSAVLSLCRASPPNVRR